MHFISRYHGIMPNNFRENRLKEIDIIHRQGFICPINLNLPFRMHFIVYFFILCFGICNLNGQTTWTGSVSNAWNNAANWTAGVPDAADTVFIPVVTNSPVVSATSNSVKSIWIDSNATLTVLSTGVLRVNGSAMHAIVNKGKVDNFGIINLGDSLNIGTQGIVNRSVFDNKSGATLKINRTSVGAIFNMKGTFTNNGIIQIGQNQNIGFFGIKNFAVFNHDAGSIAIDKSSSYGIFVDTSGVFNSNALLTIGQFSMISFPIGGNGTFNHSVTAELKSRGTVAVDTFNLNGGTIDPGFPISTLSFLGAHNLDNCDLKLTVNGKGTAGIDYDQIIISDTVKFGGTLDLTINFSNPDIGDEVIIVHSNGAKDTFDVVNGLLPDWHIIYKPNGAILRYGSATESAWIGDSSTVWSDADNWSDGVPTSITDVFINDTSTYYPILTGNGTAKSINIKAGGTLTIDASGVLELQGSNVQGIINSGIVNNDGIIKIGQTISPGFVGILNQATFNNNTGAQIMIDRSTSYGLVNFSGTFTNFGVLDIGGVSNPGSGGVWNSSVFKNLAGEIKVDRTIDGAILNDSLATFVNKGDITIGSRAYVGSYGIRNKFLFTNDTTGQIVINKTGGNAIFHTYNTFTNNGIISLGTTDSIGKTGLYLFSSFVNSALGQIMIYRSNQSGVSINGKTTADTLLANYGTVKISQIASGSNMIGGTKGYFVNNISGMLMGNGKILSPVFVSKGGTISPGTPIGIMTFVKPGTLTNNTIEIAVNGNNTPGIDFDKLNSDTLNIGGTLALTMPYSGSPGDIITIISGNKITGTFTTVTGLPSGWTLDYSAMAVNLTYITAGVTNWTGVVSSDWTDPGNWSDGVPISTSEVVIPDVATNDPTISSVVAIKSISIDNGGKLTLTASGSTKVNGSVTQGILNNGDIVNNGSILVGNSLNVGNNGIVNTGNIQNNSGATIFVDRSTINGLDNQNQILNSGTISIGSNFSPGQKGINNVGTLNNTTTGMIDINRSTDMACNNAPGANITNEGTINLGSGQNIGTKGILNAGTFNNLAGAQLKIDRSTYVALDNQGTFHNYSSVFIGSVTTTGQNGIITNSTWTNHTSGSIKIDNITDAGIYNSGGGNATNDGTIQIGASSNGGQYGIWNANNFTNTGTIEIDHTSTYGIWNYLTTFNNSGTIQIGGNTNVGSYGIYNNGAFNNLTSGLIAIDRTTSAGIYNYDATGLFSNNADINIGSNNTVGEYGIVNIGKFNNNAGSLTIDRSINSAIYIDNRTFTNYAAITIGSIASVGNYGIRNRNIFNNESGAIKIDNVSNAGFYSEAGTFLNKATVIIGQLMAVTNLITGVSGSFDNNGSGILKGTGNIQSNYFEDNGGTIVPGYSPGLLTFNGNILLNQGIMDMEVNGKTGAGIDFDQVQINGNVTIGGTLHITNNFLGAMNGDQVTIIQASAISGTFASIVGLPANWTIEYLSTSIVLHLGPFLPVKLINFNAAIEGSTVRLRWQTADELNNKGFEIQRSRDARNWEVVDFIPGSGQDQGFSSYSFVDQPGILKEGQAVFYYRLKQVDLNGNFSFSKVEFVDFTKNMLSQEIKFYPNPLPDDFLIVETGEMNGYKEIMILNTSGQTMIRQNLYKGKNTIKMNGLLPGIYFIKVMDDRQKKTYKLVKIGGH